LRSSEARICFDGARPIEIDPAVVTQIQSQIVGAGGRANQGPTGGILLGTCQGAADALSVVRCKPCGASADYLAYEALKHLQDAERPRPAGGTPRALTAVGLYRILEDEDVLPPADVALVERVFACRPHVVVLASSSRPSLSLFSWRDGELRKYPEEISFTASRIASPDAAKGRATAHLRSNDYATWTMARYRWRRSVQALFETGRWWLAGVALSAAVAGWAIAMRPARREPAQPLINDSVPLKQPESAFNLTASRVGDDWRLTWNRSAPALLHARVAVVMINDGALRREVMLDSAQISSGAVVYSPVQDEVQFRMAVIAADGANLSEVVTALGPKPSNLRSMPILSPETVVSSGKELLGSLADRQPMSRRKKVVVVENPADVQTTTPRPFQPPIWKTPGVQTQSVSLPEPWIRTAPLLPRTPDVISLSALHAELPTPRLTPPDPASQQPAAPLPKAQSSSPAALPFSPARIVRQTPLTVPPEIRTLSRQGLKLSVTVELDREGRPIRTRLPAGTGVSGYAGRLLASAIREQWKFAPARIGDEAVPSELVIHVELRPGE
jgi:hypothetical protein